MRCYRSRSTQRHKQQNQNNLTKFSTGQESKIYLPTNAYDDDTESKTDNHSLQNQHRDDNAYASLNIPLEQQFQKQASLLQTLDYGGYVPILKQSKTSLNSRTKVLRNRSNKSSNFHTDGDENYLFNKIINNTFDQQSSQVNKTIENARRASKLLSIVYDQPIAYDSVRQDFILKNSDFKQAQISAQTHNDEATSIQTQKNKRNMDLKILDDEQMELEAKQQCTQNALKFNMIKRPKTPNRNPTSRNKSINLLKNSKKARNKDILLNQDYIDSEQFKTFIEYKQDKNEFRKPNKIFSQKLGQLNPLQSSNRIQTANNSNLNDYLSFINKRSSINLRQINVPSNKKNKRFVNQGHNRTDQAFNTVETNNYIQNSSKSIFDIPNYDLDIKQQELEDLKVKRDDLKFNNYQNKIERINHIKDYLWDHRNILKKDQIMRLAILIDRMSKNIELIENNRDVLGGKKQNRALVKQLINRQL
ncbi:UNKNOWN [Stylonychia lemnae]|uniref:Uncharacterized protein n=1 Tax=Stylonychia lemnae TaxID=5949 RepID=A0A078BDV9_STYLE|nr:UNKNOWN [Stylonychia lemnae]|eukprot:CDW91352.1 UNKNOWN [Stylonychia lemnae]